MPITITGNRVIRDLLCTSPLIYNGSHISGSLYISAKCQFSNNEIVYSLKTFTFVSRLFPSIHALNRYGTASRHLIESLCKGRNGIGQSFNYVSRAAVYYNIADQQIRRIIGDCSVVLRRKQLGMR